LTAWAFERNPIRTDRQASGSTKSADQDPATVAVSRRTLRTPSVEA
jgi:hypothetical protein